MRHLIDFGDPTRAEWESLYQRCSDIMDHPADFMDACHGRVMAGLSCEPSIRTNFSFQTAVLRVGGTVFDLADPKSTSTTKGEALKDTIKMMSDYANVVVMRNPKEGAAKVAPLYSDVPVINAGNSGHMRPTQTTADLTTITRLRGKVDGLSVGLCGDLKDGRTVHFLIKVLAKFEGIRFFLIALRELAMPEYMQVFMREHDMWFTEVTGLEAVVPQLDVLYVTRIQQERFVGPLEYERCKGVYVLTRRKLDRVRKELLVMHPLLRADKITIDMGDGPRAVYFEQARYDMHARMALLTDLANQEREKPESMEVGVKPVYSNPNCITQTGHYLPPLVKQNDGVDCCAYCGKELRQGGSNLRRTRGYYVLP